MDSRGLDLEGSEKVAWLDVTLEVVGLALHRCDNREIVLLKQPRVKLLCTEPGDKERAIAQMSSGFSALTCQEAARRAASTAKTSVKDISIRYSTKSRELLGDGTVLLISGRRVARPVGDARPLPYLSDAKLLCVSERAACTTQQRSERKDLCILLILIDKDDARSSDLIGALQKQPMVPQTTFQARDCGETGSLSRMRLPGSPPAV